MSDNRRRLIYGDRNNENLYEFSFTVCSLNIATSANLSHPWSNRLDAIKESGELFTGKTIYFDGNSFSGASMWAPDIIGFQEVANYNNQFNDLVDLLGSDYGYYNAYRGVTSISTDNESCPIFFNKNRFKLVKNGHFWLSSVPNEESLNWVKVKRICVWVILKEIESNQNILVLNTHLPSYQLYNSSVQKGEAIRWSLNVIRNQINNIISNNGTMPIVLLGDLNANSDTKTANSKPIIQSIIGQSRSEGGESLGTNYYFFNTTTYGSHSVIDSRYKYNYSDPNIEMPIIGADYTMITDSNNNWSITPAFKISSDKSYAQFDYILLSRWPEGDGVYDSNTRMWCGHDIYTSYITPFVAGSGDNMTPISDHCAVISRITVHNPKGWKYEPVNINLTIKTENIDKKDDGIKIVSSSNKAITTSMTPTCFWHVGEKKFNTNVVGFGLDLNFLNSKVASWVSGSLSSYEIENSNIADFDRSIINSLYLNRYVSNIHPLNNDLNKNVYPDDKIVANITYRNDFMPLSGVYLNGVTFHVVAQQESDLTMKYLLINSDFKSILSNAEYIMQYETSEGDLISIPRDDKSSSIFNLIEGLPVTWYYGKKYEIIKPGTILRGYSNQTQYDNSNIHLLELRIPCDFLLQGYNPISQLDKISLSLSNKPTIYLMGGNQIDYEDYAVSINSNGYIKVLFYLEMGTSSQNIMTVHSSFNISPFQINIKIND